MCMYTVMNIENGSIFEIRTASIYSYAYYVEQSLEAPLCYHVDGNLEV